MSDRFEELLTKGRSGKLTPDETEELARLLNAPLLGHLTNPLPEFASKHAFAATDVAGRVRAVDWFAHVGEPLVVDLTMPFEQVGSWAEAIQRCREDGWENAQLEAQNQLSLWLGEHDRACYQDWNRHVDGHKQEVVMPLVDRVLRPLGLGDAVLNSVQWDVLAALMENTYLGSGHRSFFFTELLGVYEAGHLPCGWRGAWPSGTLLVY